MLAESSFPDWPIGKNAKNAAKPNSTKISSIDFENRLPNEIERIPPCPQEYKMSRPLKATFLTKIWA
jgi:hypothetical protein